MQKLCPWWMRCVGQLKHRCMFTSGKWLQEGGHCLKQAMQGMQPLRHGGTMLTLRYLVVWQGMQKLSVLGCGDACIPVQVVLLRHYVWAAGEGL
jgi:hypothetical protein